MKRYQAVHTLILFVAMMSALVTRDASSTDAGTGMTELENATYSGIEGQQVTLADGRWEGAPYVEGGAARPAVGLVRNILFTGDLDADGSSETVALLWQSASGTGNNIYIAVMKQEAGGYANIATSLVGDRVKIRGGRIDSGVILLDVLQAGEDDPMCCPTLLATRSWVLKDGRLEEQKMQVTGKLSLEVLAQSSWRLTRMNLHQTLPADAEVTLSFDAGRVYGKSACNRYSADIREGDKPGEIVIGQAMLTRMACADHLMEIESRYLASLSLVSSFSFHVGSLALNGMEDDGAPFTMLFSAQDADTP
ncbi:MAG: META domain-containing protein [Lysobacterales bacterium]